MVMGDEPQGLAATGYRDRVLTVAPPLLLMGVILLLGLWLPVPFRQLLQDAAALLEVRS